ncbi:MAG: hypothetical protein VKK62_01175 [Synechococcaceae cyanobacterium]|nr:hypothetical protein [Synechococcaceae cyanobacterium]
MVRRHWLDPLARRLLIATGQIPAPAAPPREAGLPAGAHPAPAGVSVEPGAGAGLRVDEEVERELLALKLRRQPGLRLRTVEEVRHAAALGWRLDVNRATAADWLRLPGCTADQAQLLLRTQAAGLQLCGPDDLQQLLGVSEQQITGWLPLLDFRWYAEAAPATLPPPLAINQAPEQELARRLGLTAERLRRLLQERARRPFQDLADLQQRLQLPPALLESWIGRISFQAGPAAGPQLPAPGRRPGR